MDTIQARQSAGVKLWCERPPRVHYLVRNHESNRRFLEDVLGIPLVATQCERTYRTDLGREVHFCHTFFALADGRTLAFIQFGDPEMHGRIRAKGPPKLNSDHHIALKVGDQTYEELKSRLCPSSEFLRQRAG